VQDAIGKDDKMDKDVKEKTGADRDKPDKTPRDHKDKKEGKGFGSNHNIYIKYTKLNNKNMLNDCKTICSH